MGQYTIYHVCLFSVINSLICNTAFINESMDPDAYIAIYIQIPALPHRHTNLVHLLRQPQINIALDISNSDRLSLQHDIISSNSIIVFTF